MMDHEDAFVFAHIFSLPSGSRISFRIAVRERDYTLEKKNARCGVNIPRLSLLDVLFL